MRMVWEKGERGERGEREEDEDEKEEEEEEEGRRNGINLLGVSNYAPHAIRLQVIGAITLCMSFQLPICKTFHCEADTPQAYSDRVQDLRPFVGRGIGRGNRGSEGLQGGGPGQGD